MDKSMPIDRAPPHGPTSHVMPEPALQAFQFAGWKAMVKRSETVFQKGKK
jgi:hypothetical protein